MVYYSYCYGPLFRLSSSTYYFWAYELTPEGIIPTAEIDATDSVIHKTGKRVDIVTIGAVCVAVVLMFFRPYIVPEGPSEKTSLPENSRVAELIAEAS